MLFFRHDLKTQCFPSTVNWTVFLKPQGFPDGSAVKNLPALFVLVPLSQTWWTFQTPAGLSVRSVGSTSPTKWHSTRRARILYVPRESDIMIGSRVAVVGRLSRFSGKRRKPQRRLYWGLNVLSPTVDGRECWLLRDASILSWEAIRRERAKWSNFELHILFYYEDNKSLRSFTSFSSSWCFFGREIKMPSIKSSLGN